MHYWHKSVWHYGISDKMCAKIVTFHCPESRELKTRTVVDLKFQTGALKRGNVLKFSQ